MSGKTAVILMFTWGLLVLTALAVGHATESLVVSTVGIGLSVSSGLVAMVLHILSEGGARLPHGCSQVQSNNPSEW